MIEKWQIDASFFENFEFCCSLLRNNITLENIVRDGQVVMYDPTTRRYSVRVIKRKGFLSPIKFCPYCGKTFPQALDEERYNTIMNEFGEEYWRNEQKLPPEFQTDEWWKKRGL